MPTPTHVVSTLIGFQSMHPLPPPLMGTVYSTEKKVQGEGWNNKQVRLKVGDSLVNSLSAKWAKFRNYPWDAPDLYIDASIAVNAHIVRRAEELADRDILVGYEPTQRTLWEEVASAERQERYMRNSHKAKEWIRSFGDQIRDLPTVRTGFVFARPTPLAKEFFKEIYTTCVELEYPECQIVFTTLMQLPKYKGLVRVVEQCELGYKLDRKRVKPVSSKTH